MVFLSLANRWPGSLWKTRSCYDAGETGPARSYIRWSREHGGPAFPAAHYAVFCLLQAVTIILAYL